MFHLPEHYNSLSLRLSEVLNDIGVNERMVKIRRRSALLMETSISHSLPLGGVSYIFGSRSEGTTTNGLKSDTDVLTSHPHFNLIQDCAEWKTGLINLLMIQDDEASPGYCHLQLIRRDMPLPVTDVINKHCFRDAHGKILLKNTAFDEMFSTGIKNGPAMTSGEQHGVYSNDIVIAVSCESWPTAARYWSNRRLGSWPTEEMKRYVVNSGCFVVPVGSKVSQIESLEWRISTSKAERCLMFNLNITQIRCFVLLKMILKRYLEHPVSSYMCKTVLLRCIEKTRSNMWQEKNLFTCLTVCLQALRSSVLYKSCPHYFIPENNLMAGRFSPRMKEKVLKSLCQILRGHGAALFGIQTDDIGERLQIKMNPFYQSVQSTHLLTAEEISLGISGSLFLRFACELLAPIYCLVIQGDNYLGSPIAVSEMLVRDILKFITLCKNGTNATRKVLQLLVPFYCPSFGSVLASVNIGTNSSVSAEALNWLLIGLNSDVSSGRLKLASVLYCSGDMIRAESVLREAERLYRLDSVEPVCSCYDFKKRQLRKECCRVCFIQNENAINSTCAFCVRFFPAEINCIPHELQYELFRSTREEMLRRNMCDCWMKMAVVDSLPFMYFLQYKTYGNLQSYNDQQRALGNLALSINVETNFGQKETAVNLLGQCMEQENRLYDALSCYTASLNIRGTNNAARFHLCILLAGMQNNLQ